MKIIVAGERTGKTSLLIKKSSELMLPIVCYSQAKASSIKYKAERLGLHIPEPIVYQDPRLMHKQDLNGVLIDDLDLFLEHLMTTKVVYATSTGSIEEMYETEEPKGQLYV